MSRTSPLPPASNTLAAPAAAACRAPVAPAAPSRQPASDLPVRTPARSLLGPRPLIAGEDGAEYDDILQRISADAAPGDFIEEIWVRNVGDLVWESIRLRRLKAQLMQAAAYQGLEEVLTPLLDDGEDADELARRWAVGDETPSWRSSGCSAGPASPWMPSWRRLWRCGSTTSRASRA
jgi:hypothetical protein